MSNQRLNESYARLISKLRSECSERDITRLVNNARSIANQPFPSINKDSVLESYNGLIEKFYILGRDDLACELEIRLDSLEKSMEGRRNYMYVELAKLVLSVSDGPEKVTLNEWQILDKRETNYIEILSSSEEEIVEDHVSIADTLSEWSDDDTAIVQSESVQQEQASSSLFDTVMLPHTDPSHPQSFAALALESKKVALQPNWNQIQSVNWVLSENELVRELFLAFMGYPNLLFEYVNGQLEVRDAIEAGIGLYHLSAELLYDSFLPSTLIYLRMYSELRRLSGISWSHPVFENVISTVSKSLDTKAQEMYLKSNSRKHLTLFTARDLISKAVTPYMSLLQTLRQVEEFSRKHPGASELIVFHNKIYEELGLMQKTGQSVAATQLKEILAVLISEYVFEFMIPWVNGDTFCANSKHFMIQANEACKSPWHMYSIRETAIPAFLAGCEQLVLNIGRSATLLTSNHRRITSIDWANFVEKSDASNFKQSFKTEIHLSLQQIYSQISAELSACLLHKETGIMSAIKTQLKLYFMMDQRMVDFCQVIYAAVNSGCTSFDSLRHVLVDSYRLTDLNELFNVRQSQEHLLQVEPKLPHNANNTRIFDCIFTDQRNSMLRQIWSVLFDCGAVAFELAQSFTIRYDAYRMVAMTTISQLMGYMHAGIVSQMSTLLSSLGRLDENSLALPTIIDLYDCAVSECYSICMLETASSKEILRQVLSQLSPTGPEVYQAANTVQEYFLVANI